MRAWWTYRATYSGAGHKGDRTTPFLGTTLVLNNLYQAYGVRGSSVYTKVLATAVSRLVCPKPLYKALANNYLARARPPA